MSEDVFTSAPRRTHAVIAIVLSLLGAALQFWGFVYGISAALDGSGRGPGAFVLIFFGGTVLVLAAIVMSIIGLVRRRAKGLWVVALVISLLPITVIVIGSLVSR